MTALMVSLVNFFPSGVKSKQRFIKPVAGNKAATPLDG
jgi:hypothetical protein